MKAESSTLSLLEAPAATGAMRPCLYLVLESARPRGGALRLPLHGVDELRVGRGDRREWEQRRESGADHLVLRVPDPRLSSSHFRVVRIGRSFVVEDLGSKNGTLVGGSPAAREPLGDGAVIQAGGTFFLFREAALSTDDPASPVSLGDGPGSGALSTLVPSFARELERIRAVSRAEVPVVLLGETGTGKEVVARAIHVLSERPGPFVAVNCGALPDTLVESELFGFRKGAFSGALEDRPGLVRSASRGTLFLDEIGDLPMNAQASLLRVLQEREVRPIGAAQPVAVDLRVICATHRDLDAMVRAGTFREDLLARLSGFVARLPPLRDRREDLGVIVATLLARLVPDGSTVSFTPAASRALVEFAWPGNVRELEQALSRALALASGQAIDVGDIDLRATAAPAPRPPRPLSDEDRKLREEIERSLDAHGGNVSAVAREMGKDRKQIRRWIERLGIGRKL